MSLKTPLAHWLERLVGPDARYRLALALGVSLGLRLIIVGLIAAHPNQSLWPDSPTYLNPAATLLLAGRFSQSATPPYLPDALRTPGYPAFLAVFVWIFQTQQPILPVVVAQAVLGALTSAITMWLGQRLVDTKTGFIAGMAHAIAPMQILMIGWILTETVFTMMLTASLLLLAVAIQAAKGWAFAATGALAGIAALVRPVGILILIPLALAIALQSGLAKKWQAVVLLALGYFVAVGPWMARNYFTFGRADISTAMDFHLYHYDVPAFVAQDRQISLDAAQQVMEQQRSQKPLTMDKWPYASEGLAARDVILQRPLPFLLFHTLESIQGAARPGFSFMLVTLVGDEAARESTSMLASGNLGDSSQAAIQQSWWLLIIEFYMAATLWGMLALAAVGLVTLLRQRQWFVAVVCGLLPAALLFPAGISGNARYRSPIEPLLIVLAVIGAYWLISLYRRRAARLPQP